MAQEAGDGLSINEDRPDIDQPEGYDYRELQHIKKGLRIRLEKEHNCAAAVLAVDGTGGEHLNGSAVAYEGAGPITKRPDTSTDLADNAYDRGRLWLDDNYDPPILKRWAGAAWEVIGRMLADTESLVITLANEKQEDIDGGRETLIKFKGEKADGTAHELAVIRVQHDGAGDDYKGDLILYVNDGNDADGSLTEVMRIDSAKLVTFAGAITAGGVITNPEIPVFTKGVVANDTYLRARNPAGDGNVDMIKVGRNEANDADVVILPDKVRTATNAAPAEDTAIVNKKYADDNFEPKLVSQATASIFGAWTNLDSDTNALAKTNVYKATSDGIVMAYKACTAGWAQELVGYTDNNNPPTTVRCAASNANTLYATITMPVKKNDYFKIVANTAGNPTIYWLPIGTGVCQKQ